MKRTLIIAGLVVLALGVLGVGAASAQGEQPPFSYGWMMGGRGVLHTYVVEAFADKLGLTAEAINDRLLNGETMFQIAIDEGISEADIAIFLTEVHSAAFKAAVDDGVLTQAQADAMLERMHYRFENSYAPGNCPMHNGTIGQYGSGFGPGLMSGRGGQNWGPGMMGGQYGQYR